MSLPRPSLPIKIPSVTEQPLHQGHQKPSKSPKQTSMYCKHGFAMSRVDLGEAGGVATKHTYGPTGLLSYKIQSITPSIQKKFYVLSHYCKQPCPAQPCEPLSTSRHFSCNPFYITTRTWRLQPRLRRVQVLPQELYL